MHVNKCPICNAERFYAFSTKILKKYKVKYFDCHECGLLQTEEPYWLKEAHRDAIADADTGIFARNIQVHRHLSSLLYLLDGGRGRYLDIAGGYGILVRLMRDSGFDFYWHDLFCENIFAKGFTKSDSIAVASISAIEKL